jgi:hypothetical protein
LKKLRGLQRAEQAQVRANARACAAAAECGDVAQFARFAHPDDALIIDYAQAFRRIGKLDRISPEIKAVFLEAWIVRKNWALQVNDRRALASSPHLLMPHNYAGPALQLYRDARQLGERVHRRYQFSWTRGEDLAREFATRWRWGEEPGVVLSTVASADAVLLVREDEEYYDEREVVVDPFLLSRVTLPSGCSSRSERADRLDQHRIARTAGTGRSSGAKNSSSSGRCTVADDSQALMRCRWSAPLQRTSPRNGRHRFG